MIKYVLQHILWFVAIALFAFCFSIVKNVNFNNASTYAAPVLISAIQELQLSCQFHVLGLGKCGVVVDDAHGIIAGCLYYLAVLGYVGYVQVERYAALLRSLHVAWAA